MRKALLFCSLSIVLFTCDDDDEAPPNNPIQFTYFTFKCVDFISGTTGTWFVMLHDKNGKLIKGAEFNNATEITFQAREDSVPETFAVSIMSTESYDQLSRTFTGDTYLNVSPFTTWTLKNKFKFSPPFASPLLGAANITVSSPDLGDPIDAVLSRPMQESAPSGSTPGNFIFSNIQVFDGRTDHLLSITDNNREPRYKYIEQLTPGDHNYTLDDFVPFDVERNFEFPATNQPVLIVFGYKNEASVFSNDHYYTTRLIFTQQGLADNLKAGFLNWLPKYRIYFSALYQDYALRYEHAGAVPGTVLFPISFDATYPDKSFASFSFSSSGNFTRRTSVFNGALPAPSLSAAIIWRVHASNQTDFKSPTELPLLILNKFPYLDLSVMQHAQTDFYTTSETYDEFVTDQFVSENWRETYSRIVKSIY